ncbi:NACHT domain-containing protein, partial [Flavobacterium araucananum]
TELWIINFFKKELLNAIKKENYKKKDFDEYIKSQLEKTKKQNSKFVSLILKELANQNETSKNGFIEDLITKNTTRMRILGQGGSGKTTTLEHLVYKDTLKWIETPLNSQIPVLVTLGNLTANESITESIAKKLNIGYEDVEELYKTNEIKIYLDGLNEIVENRESKKIKLQEIDSIIEDYPNLSIIITDRYEFDSYQNNMFNIPTFIIQKLSKNQIEEFVLKNCNNSQEQSNQVLKILNSKSNIQELLLRPLILTRAIEIIKIENDLPEKESQIIEKFLNILLRREKDEKKDPLLNVNNFKLLLSYAANEIYAKYKTNASVHEFSFSKMLNEASEKYGLEKFNAGYVSRIGYELEILSKNEELIQFYHQSYLEFFCSHYLKYEYK